MENIKNYLPLSYFEGLSDIDLQIVSLLKKHL